MNVGIQKPIAAGECALYREQSDYHRLYIAPLCNTFKACIVRKMHSTVSFYIHVTEMDELVTDLFWISIVM